MRKRNLLVVILLLCVLILQSGLRASAQQGPEAVGTADIASVKDILPFLNTQSDGADSCATRQTASVMRFDTTGKTGSTVGSVQVDIPIFSTSSLTGNVDISLAAFPNDFGSATIANVGSLLATKSYTAGNYPSGTLSFSGTGASDPLVSAVQAAVTNNQAISFAVIISSCTIGNPAIQFAKSPTIVVLDPSAVDFYSFRSGGAADMTMIGLGLLVAVGLLAGTGFTLAKRRRA